MKLCKNKFIIRLSYVDEGKVFRQISESCLDLILILLTLFDSPVDYGINLKKEVLGVGSFEYLRYENFNLRNLKYVVTFCTFLFLDGRKSMQKLAYWVKS